MIDYYETTPEYQDLKNGHVLKLYIDNERSVAHTIRAISTLVPVSHKITDHSLKPIITKLGSYKHLDRKKEKEDFVKFCDKPLASFTLTEPNGPEAPPIPVDASAITETPKHRRIDPDFTSISSASSSRHALTPRKLKLKSRLAFVSAKRSSEKKVLKKRIRNLNEKLDTQKFNTVKYLNQDIKRKKISMKKKDANIVVLKGEILRLKKEKAAPEKLRLNKQAEADPTSEKRLKSLARTHKRLKVANAEKRKKKAVTVPKNQYLKLKQHLEAKDELNKQQENELCELRDKLKEMEKERRTDEQMTKSDGKSYNSKTRMFVFDSIVNQVPTLNIPGLLQSFATRNNYTLSSVPHRTSVEQWTRELSTIADLKCAELAMKTKNLTLGFDATTQEGVHINSIHFNTETDCEVVAVDELPGGTADDYSNHITSSVDYLAETYSDYHKEEYQFCRSTIISNITNTMNDRVAANHATINKVNESWGKTLNELNCHLHPLDTIASSCRSALKSLETSEGVQTSLFGRDCVAANIVVQVNKFRYKDGKGDPKGFKSFLREHNLPMGIIPRYRGNRFHVIFHICGKLVEHYPLFLNFFKNGVVTCGGLLTSIRKDFEHEYGILEMQVLGLLGKLLTGPWMQQFYTGAQDELSHIDGIAIVRKVVSTVKDAAANPQATLLRQTDFFGRHLDEDDLTLAALRLEPEDMALFAKMMASCLLAVVAVLERQYKRYFELDITEQLRQETVSARLHNIDAESIMGMFSAGKERAKNASVDFLSSRMRARKNSVVRWLDGMYSDQRESILKWAISRARKRRTDVRKKTSEVKEEISRRTASKRQKKDQQSRKATERKLKNVDINEVPSTFPELTDEVRDHLIGILNGRIVGRQILHTWYDDTSGTVAVYSGKVEKLIRNTKYRIAYWSNQETYDDATDYDIPKLQLAADLIFDDLVMC